jgi:hypothetical protein
METPKKTITPEQLHPIVEKVLNSVLRKMKVLGNAARINIDYNQWVSNHYTYTSAKEMTERLTIYICSAEDNTNINDLKKASVNWLNIIHRGLGIKRGEIKKVVIRKRINEILLR